MSRLSNLEATLRRLKREKRELEANLRTYRERHKDVKNIRNKLIDVVDDTYGSINKIISEICDDVFEALVGSMFGTNVNNSVSASQEKSSSSDGSISTALGDLNAELSRIDKKIQKWEDELENVRGDIRYVEHEIWEEKKKQAEEALKNLIGQ